MAVEYIGVLEYDKSVNNNSRIERHMVKVNISRIGINSIVLGTGH